MFLGHAHPHAWTRRAGCSCPRSSATRWPTAWSSPGGRSAASTSSRWTSSSGWPSRCGRHRSTSKAVRDYLRVFLSGASDEVPDKQGRVTIPAAPARVRRPLPRLHRHRRRPAGRGLGHHRLGRLPGDHRAGLRRAGRGGDPRPPVTRWTTRRDRRPLRPGLHPLRRPGAPSPVPGRTCRAVGDLTTGTTEPRPRTAPRASQHDHPEPHARTT